MRPLTPPGRSSVSEGTLAAANSRFANPAARRRGRHLRGVLFHRSRRASSRGFGALSCEAKCLTIIAFPLMRNAKA